MSLVNLLLNEEVVPELIQHEGSPKRLAAEAERILGDRAHVDQMRTKLASLRPTIGPAGASRRAAEEVDLFLARTLSA